MKLYLHPSEDQSLADAYKQAFARASEIFVLSAYLTEWPNFEVSEDCELATLVVGQDFRITRKAALQAAHEWKNLDRYRRHIYVAHGIDGFHPKLVAWVEGKGNKAQFFMIVGSSNLTIAAFESNYEANVQTGISRNEYEAITDWIADILPKSKPITQSWINTYEEAERPPRKGGGAPVKKPIQSGDNAVALSLPRFPGLARALAQRRERVFEFDEMREALEEQVKGCAQGSVSQNAFYDWLIKNWNNQLWKFQGNGIFRRDKTNTNWQKLCAGLLTCIDSQQGQRDQVVQQVYDDLEASEEVEVRKAFLTEMLCHFFPKKYPLWNTPVETWIRKVIPKSERPRGLSSGQKYLLLAKQLRRALQATPNYPAQDLAELDHVIWAYCKYSGWTK